MNRLIEQAIENLLPRYSGIIPPLLIELATSIFALSRNKCSLKPEEEVARAYACANLACERLKGQLNLSSIEPRPPIPPRAYDKLYTYLSNTLEPKTPSKKHGRSNSSTLTPHTRPTSLKPVRIRSKPICGNSLGQISHPIGKRKDHHPDAMLESTIPQWVMPVVRLLCRHMCTPKATAHTLAGVESILCLPIPSKPKGESLNPVNLKLPAMIAAVWLVVVAKIRGQDEENPETAQRKKMVLEFLVHVKENEILQQKLGDSEKVWRRWEIITDGDISAWSNELISGNWRDMDWWRNIAEGTEVGGTSAEGTEVGGTSAEEDPNGDSYRDEILMGEMEQGGFGQDKEVDKYDYLNEDRKRDYAEWKSKIQSHIEAMIMAQG